MKKKAIVLMLAGLMVFTGCSAGTSGGTSVTGTAESAAETENGTEEGQTGEADSKATEADGTSADTGTAAEPAGSDTGALTGDEWLQSEVERMQEGGALDPAFTIVTKTTKEVPIYFNSQDDKGSVTLAFFDEDGVVPYISLSDVPAIVEKAYQIQYADKNYKLSYSAEGNTATLTRESGFWMKADADRDTITFLDLDAFLKASTMASLFDVVHEGGLKSEAKTQLFQHRGNSYERYGDAVVLPLKDYGIELIKDGEDFYMPLATVNDFLMAHNYIPMVYNGQSVILYVGKLNETEMGKVYYEAPKGKISPSMSRFSYNELCLMLDYHYGLKDTHDISKFDSFFLGTGLKERLMDPDPMVADNAVEELLSLHFDDGHSGNPVPSFYSGADAELNESFGSAALYSGMDAMRFQEARDKYYPDGVPGYEEVGDTAFITFDHFTSIPEDADYYNNPPTEADPTDTVGLMLYSYAQIKREGSPVKKVVLDLSCNGGGDSTAAGFVLGTFLGTGTYSVRDRITGAMSNDYFKVDVNLDHEYDQTDSLRDYKLYCLISSSSFSCGNLVPNVFKSTHLVTLLGQTSGGGSCMVLPAATAYGMTFQISGPFQMSFAKNGSFYDVDTGAEADIYIDDPENFYKREALVKYIDSQL